MQRRIAAGSVQWTSRHLDDTLLLADQFDRQAIRGEITVQEPGTDGTTDVKMGPYRYYYRDNLGNTINSPSPTPPNSFYHRVNPER